MTGLIQDFRYALRTLLKNPGFTAVAMLALALGIGANTAIFTVVNAVLLRPLPYRDADRLAVIWQNNRAQGWDRVGASGPNYLDWEEQSKLMEDMCLFEPGTGTLTGFGEPQQVPGMRVTTNFFDVLGAKAAAGRLWTAADKDKWQIGVLTYGAWQRWFGGDPSAVGRTIKVDGLPYMIIGVLRSDFWLPVPADLFAPWPEERLREHHRLDHSFDAIGHIRSGVTLEQAGSELNAIERGINERITEHEGWGISLVPMKEALVEYIRPALLVLLGAVGFVLLIACTNIANLLLARGTGRRRELAVRAAMGAGRFRIIRQMLTESVLLGIAGGALGLIMAAWGVQLLTTVLPEHVPIPEGAGQVALARINIDAGVLLFTFSVSIATGLIFGLIPALSASRTAPVEALKESGRSTRQAAARLRGALVVAEVALALVLLVGASLMIRSVQRLQTINPGFPSAQLLTFEMELPTDSRYKTAAERSAVYDKFLHSLQQTPGLETAAITRAIPLSADQERTYFGIEGRPPAAKGEHLGAEFRPVSANYLKTLGVPVIRGRDFSDLDRAGSAGVAVIDVNLARKFFPNQDPIGHRILTRGAKWDIVGVCGEVKHTGLNKAAQPTIYVPILQYPMPHVGLVLRAKGDPAQLVRAAKMAIWAVDRDQPIFNVKTMEQVMGDSASAPKLTLVLLGVFASLALMLAAVGIYGVMSYTIGQRKHEIGIRIALGAASSHVLRMVVGEAMLLAAIGIGIGIVVASGLTRVLTTLLFGVSATDPLTFAAVAIVLAVVALAAALIPAWRATRTPPVVALRYE